jgi:hypothetical protein
MSTFSPCPQTALRLLHGTMTDDQDPQHEQTGALVRVPTQGPGPMTTSRSRTVLGVILGLALAATAVWLGVLLVRGDQPHQATQPPPTAAAATSPTETTTAPAFTRDGAVAGLRIIVRKRQQMLRTLDESILGFLYTPDCRLADGSSCLKSDQQTLRELRARNAHLESDPISITDIRVQSWEPQERTAVMKLVYDLRIGRFVNSKGVVVETEPGARQVVDQVNLVWDGTRWRQAFAAEVEGA